MAPVMVERSGTDEKVILAAAERMNPPARMTREQAQKWWDFIGVAKIDWGEITAKMNPFRDVFELGFQPL